MELLLWLILAPTITEGLPRYLPHQITTTEKPIYTKNIYYEVQDEDDNDDIHERGDSNYMTPITKSNENKFNEEENDGSNERNEEYDETRNSITMYPNEDIFQSTRQPNKNPYGKSINKSISVKEPNNLELDEKLNATVKHNGKYGNINTSTKYISGDEEKNEEQFQVNTQSTTSSKERDESDKKVTREISNEEYIKPTTSTQKNTEEKDESESKVKEDDEGKDNANNTDEQNTYDADRNQEGKKKKNRREDYENQEKIADKGEETIHRQRMNENDRRKLDGEDDLGKNKKETNTNKLTPRPPIECKKKDLCNRYEERKVNYQNDHYSNQLQEGYFKHPSDASYFYTCQHGVPLCLPCPTPTLVFSEKCQMCMENGYDEICPTTKPAITQPINEDRKFCDERYCHGRENGHFSNKEERSRFYMCSNSITYCMNCPAGLSFDERCVRCVGTGNVGKKCDG